MNKLIIIGSGPAGYTAGIYSARAELKPVIFSGPSSGGQLMNTSLVENWPGNKEGILGPQLMMQMREQAVKFGVEIREESVSKIDFSKRPFKVNELEAEAVIIATGAESIRLHIPGEDRLFGRGVAVCAVCDAPFYKEKTAAVLGGGDSACEDALSLTKFAKKVYLIHRRDKLRACKILVQRVKNNPKIEILWNSQVTEILGENKVEAIRIGQKGNRATEIKVDGVFLALGHRPATDLFKGKIQLNEKNYILTGENRDYPTMTSVEGVFAAGDCVDSRYQQAITAAAMGCQAALDSERYLESRE